VNHHSGFSASFPYSEKRIKQVKCAKQNVHSNCSSQWLVSNLASKGRLFLPHKSNSLVFFFKIWRYLGTDD
jgi:hypothetical protein